MSRILLHIDIDQMSLSWRKSSVFWSALLSGGTMKKHGLIALPFSMIRRDQI